MLFFYIKEDQTSSFIIVINIINFAAVDVYRWSLIPFMHIICTDSEGSDAAEEIIPYDRQKRRG